ncbi:MAG: alkaline phosphatase family protein [Candidatus Bipolaricaulis sp.]|nr:alkaline phosphatase family protein [Candidatus Bipolaricaulis sp.]
MSVRTDVLDQLRSRPTLAGIPDPIRFPDYAGFSIVAIADLVRAALGLSASPGALVEALAPQRFERVVLIILDGLGFHRTERFCNDVRDSAFARIAASGDLLPITSVFPSTTVAALSTYSTGLPPAQHGLIGYRLYLREVSAIINMIQLSIVGADGAPATASGLDLKELLPCPTVYERLAEQGVTTHTLLPRYIAASGLSRILYRGATYMHPVVSLPDMLTFARHILERAARPTLVTLYWPELDSVAHTRGPDSDAYEAELQSIDDALRRELLGRVDRTLLVLSSDHGFVTMEPEDYRPLSDFSELRERLLLHPVGEPRASYLFLRNGGTSPWTLPTTLDGGLVALDASAAVRAGLFGPGIPHPEIVSRVGNVLIVSTARNGLLHPYPDFPFLRGMHGGLNEDELYVPLLVAPLS